MVKDLASTPPIFTLVVPKKSLPVIVIVSPLFAVVGVNEEIVETFAVNAVLVVLKQPEVELRV